MCEVIHPIDERNLLLVALYGDILPIDDQRITETLRITVPFGNVVVVRDFLQFPHKLSVRPANAFAMISCKCADACSLEMLGENPFRRFAIIDAEPAMTIIAVKSSQSSSGSFSYDLKTMTKSTGRGSSRSPFLRVNMLSMGKMASTSYRSTFSGAQNETLSPLRGHVAQPYSCNHREQILP